MDLNVIWFVLVGVLLTGYAILDGFDLGVGTLHLFVRKDEHRRLLLNSIGPVWDGNEVWLVTGGGALFAAFPEAYATVFSGFYLAFMLLLCSLIFRAVAIEFRSKEPWGWWRKMWDIAFCLGSVLSSFLIGVAMGNIVRGVPLGPDYEFAGTFLGLLNPYSLFLGVTTVVLFAMHGAIYLVMKNDGELQMIVRGWVPRLIGIFITCYVIFNMVTLVYVDRMVQVARERPWILAVMLLDILIVMNIPREIHKGRTFNAFLSSCAGMALLMATFGLSQFPYMVFSEPNPENSLTIYNAASSPKTLGIMLIIAGIGVPIVLAYTACIYWIFRGKTRLTSHSY
jgi:cytochrome d ubiquinol oxidase subunit II